MPRRMTCGKPHSRCAPVVGGWAALPKGVSAPGWHGWARFGILTPWVQGRSRQRAALTPRGDVAKWSKAGVCKTPIRRFESARRLHSTTPLQRGSPALGHEWHIAGATISCTAGGSRGLRGFDNTWTGKQEHQAEELAAWLTIPADAGPDTSILPPGDVARRYRVTQGLVGTRTRNEGRISLSWRGPLAEGTIGRIRHRALSY